jgi:hypothetical protein
MKGNGKQNAKQDEHTDKSEKKSEFATQKPLFLTNLFHNALKYYYSKGCFLPYGSDNRKCVGCYNNSIVELVVKGEIWLVL